jgi:predicted nucleic acid-binding protein
MAWLQKADWLLPVVVVAEIGEGAEQAPGPGRRLEILRRLDDFLRESGDLVVPWDMETARVWSGLRHSSEVKRKPQALWDSLIDALAVRHGGTIASRDAGDFRHAPVLDPWTGKLHRPGR